MRLVLAALAKAGLRAVALKGPVLAERLYGDPSLRYSSDLDILVSPHDLEPTSDLLQSLGYQERGGPYGRYERSHTHNLSFFHARHPLVELHFHLLVEFGVTVPAEDFLSRAVPYRAQDGTDCWVLSPADEAFYLCLHAVHHEFARFCWLYDIWTLVRLHPGLDWDDVYARAEQGGVRQALCFSLELLRRRLGIAAAARPAPFRGGPVRQRLGSVLLRVHHAAAPSASLSTLTNLLFKAALCDRTLDSLAFLGHNLGRITRRRIRRYLPGLAPAEWSA
jgi:hypothetical protein